MDAFSIGLLGIAALLVLLMLGMHIGIAMMLVGIFGFASVTGIPAALGVLKTVLYSTASKYSLTVIPLFVLMGQFAFYSGLSKDLYAMSYKWLGHLRGGLSMATIGACAFFAAICGSSPATAATMCVVALPEMKEYGYNNSLSSGSIAAGGTLGMLIPPSVGFVLYGIIAEQSIGKLFAAGVVPGIMLALLYMVTIAIMVRRDPQAGPAGPKVTFKEKLMSIKDVWGVLLLFIVVIGGIFTGFCTVNEAAALGAFGALIFMASRGKLNKKNFFTAIKDTGRTTAMVFIIIIGAYVFGYFLAVTKLPFTLAHIITSLSVSRYVILILVMIIYIILGCVMDSLAMVLLTVPIFLPVMLELGFDPIWYGVIMVMVMEQGLITPPVGVNVYVINGVAKDIPLQTIFKGVMPFWVAIIVAVILLTIFPQIALFLPNLLF